jgi:hypothetical protein
MKTYSIMDGGARYEVTVGNATLPITVALDFMRGYDLNGSDDDLVHVIVEDEEGDYVFEGDLRAKPDKVGKFTYSG